MHNITLLYSHADRVFATQLARELVEAGLKVRANHSIKDITDKKSTLQLTRLGSSLFVPLLSQNFVRTERPSFQMVSDMLNLDSRIVYNISLDPHWKNMKFDSVKGMKKRVYKTENADGRQHDPKLVAQLLWEHISKINDESAMDHHDPRNLKALLCNTQSTIQCIYEGDASKPARDCRIYKDTDRKTNRDQFFVWLNPRCVLAKVREFLEEEFEHINRDNMIAVQSSKQSLSSIEQLQSAQKILGFDVVTFDVLIDRVTRRETETPPKIFPDEPAVLIPQELNVVGNGRYDAVSEKLTNTSDFIQNFRSLRNLHQDLSMIAIIKGGGSGKSHTIEVFHDHLLDEGVDEIFIFSGREVETNINNGSNPTIRSLYDIYYYAVKARNIGEPLSKEHFELWFLTKEAYFIVDGVEEITGFIGNNFDKAAFVADCIRILNKNPKGTIVTTSRTVFWNSAQEDHIMELSFSLFTKKDKHRFFDKKYEDDPRSAALAKNIEAQISDGPASEDSQLPLFCELIYMFVNRIDNEVLIKKIQSKEFKGPEGLNDLLLRTMLREDRQGVKWDVDAIRRGLRHVALETIDGAIAVDTLQQCFAEELGYELTENQSRSIQNLIFLKKIPGQPFYKIRFPFLKTILLAEYCTANINDDLGDFLQARKKHRLLFARHMAPNGDVADRFLAAKTGVKADKFADVIRGLCAHTVQADNDNQRQLLISNLFYICLKSNNALAPTDTLKYLKAFFETPLKSGQISGLCCIGYNDSPADQPRFDFRDLTLRGCKFFGYDSIWKCTANKDTHFITSSFLACDGHKSSTGIANAQFTDYRFDSNFSKLIDLGEDHDQEHSRKKFKDISVVLHHIVKSREYRESRNLNDLITNLEKSITADIKRIIGLLVENEVLIYENTGSSQTSVKIKEGQTKFVKAFLDNSVPSAQIQQVIDTL